MYTVVFYTLLVILAISFLVIFLYEEIEAIRYFFVDALTGIRTLISKQ